LVVSERRHKRWIAVIVVVAVLFAGWRWHEAHLSTPIVPSTWVNFDQNSATMFRWVITGQHISGIYTWDEVTNNGCIVAPFVGSINGHLVTLTATYLDGSGSTTWSGTVDASELSLNSGGGVFVPRSATSFAQALTAMHYPPCGPSSS
jgi:hypothetical protein